MPNIVYVLTNPAMPGIVKIGMTDRANVQHRMGELYSTGVPLPFDCVIAREIEDRNAVEIENALHTAFGPHRINSSREFFQLEPEQVEVLLQVMPGKDVTPPATDQSADLSPDDREASEEFKKRQSRTNEEEFLDSLNENGKTVSERVLSFGKQTGMRINWGRKGFTLNVESNGALVLVCYVAGNQKIYTSFPRVREKSNVPHDAVDMLRESALETGLFEPSGKRDDLACRTNRNWDEAELDKLMGWLSTVVEHIRQYES
ncbi:MAG: GIY-YIG nuclease family protein [Caldilineaceae bacterium]|nr:GIY-YIG nuclease family protein [Caldilineaceae bacterium]